MWLLDNWIVSKETRLKYGYSIYPSSDTQEFCRWMINMNKRDRSLEGEIDGGISFSKSRLLDAKPKLKYAIYSPRERWLTHTNDYFIRTHSEISADTYVMKEAMRGSSRTKYMENGTTRRCKDVPFFMDWLDSSRNCGAVANWWHATCYPDSIQWKMWYQHVEQWIITEYSGLDSGVITWEVNYESGVGFASHVTRVTNKSRI